MDDTVEEASAERPGGFGSLGSILHLLVLAWAAVLASFPLNDNSFFTHLATGRLILDEGRVPTTDPYTFTAHGEPWTVQSWLASVAYAGAERLGGDVGLRVLVLAVFLTATTLLWRLTTPARSLLTRIALMGIALVVATDLWTSRPYMVGVIGLAILWFALEGRVQPWLLLPTLWVWVNTHGSWIVGLALIATALVGAMADRRIGGRSVRPSALERRVAGFSALGVALGAANPLGPKLLAFPFSAVTDQGAFSDIVEWQAPGYDRPGQMAFLALVLVLALLLARGSSWQLALPAVLFTGMALYAQRNVAMATVVLVAVAARTTPTVGTLTAAKRAPFGAVAGGLAVAVVGLVAATAISTPAVTTGALEAYPARALAWLDERSATGNIATQDFTGNLLEVLDGEEAAVFVDDRYDMFPADLVNDVQALTQAVPSWQRVLDRHDIDVVVWEAARPISAVLAAHPSWVVRYADGDAIVACRRRTGCGLG